MAVQAADLVVVGGGAAGMTAAIHAARLRPGLDVLILESRRQPGAKLLVSGGGRCNIANVRVAPADFNSGQPRAVAAVLRRFGLRETRAFLASLGLELEEEQHGRLYPSSRRAEDVLAAFLREAERLGVRWRCGDPVVSIALRDDGFHLCVGADEARAPRVVLAAGGQSLPRSGSDGSGFRLADQLGLELAGPFVPALASLRLPERHPLLELAGVSLEAALRLEGDTTRQIWRGDLLVAHFGLSGPAALDISRHALRELETRGRAVLLLDWLPALEEEALRRRLASPAAGRLVEAILREHLPARLGQALMGLAGLPADLPRAQLSRPRREELLRQVKRCPLPVMGARSWHHAEATAGGVALEELDPATLEARRVPGLHLCGEVCDVDGRLGGFNFQWAWSSGALAGRAAAAGLSHVSRERRIDIPC